MKHMFTILLAGCALCCAQPQPAQAQEYKTHVSKEFTVTKASTVLAIYNIFGSVKVEGYAGDKVILEIDQKITARNESVLEEGKKEFRLAFDHVGDTIVAYIAEPNDSRPRRSWNRDDWNDRRRIEYKYHLNFTVKVPYSMNLDVSTVNDGDVTVKDVTGSLNVHNVNGDITIVNAKGAAIKAVTVNGDVVVNHLEQPPTDARYHTINGKLDITYPANLSADLSFKSMNGSFYTDFPEVEMLPAKVTKTEEKRANGTLYKINKETDVRIGSGGKNYRFETLNGNVYISKNKLLNTSQINNMKKMKAAMLIAAMMLAAGSQAQTEQITVPLSDPGKPFTLSIGLISGSIKVVGYEGKDIVIDAVSGEARKSQREKEKQKDKNGVNVNVNINIPQSLGRDKESTSGMKRLNGAGSGMEVTVEEKSNRVTVNSDSHKRPIDFIIKVPMSSAKLKLSTINSGDINVSNVSGEMEIENTNGDITVSSTSGSLVANTINGDIVATLKTVDGKTPMAFSTLNGKVDITLPADIKVSLKAKSDMGHIYSDFDVAIDKTAPKVTRSNEKGMYKLNIEDWVQGKINGGGPELLIKSFNGSVYVRKAK